MAVRIPAADLYRIQEEDLRNAISGFRKRSLPLSFRDSTRFDLLIDGHRRFPPKAIVALAAQRLFGRVLSSNEFVGGESSTVFRLLLERGFELTTKLLGVAELDATFSVGCSMETQFVLVESRGPNRNTDYGQGLDALLRGLADLDASIEDILVDSVEARASHAGERRAEIKRQSYPFRLRSESDLGALRRDIARAAAAASRSPGASGSGNPTKRLRIAFAEPQDMDVYEIATFLARNRGLVLPQTKTFVFRPRPPAPGGGETNRRNAIEETDVTHIHYQMQQSLYKSLVAIHGLENVCCEGTTSSGRPADVIVNVQNGFEIFEIKTALAPRDCVRESLGQLLEYAYWPGAPDFNALWIVGPTPIDDATQRHLDGLRKRFGMPLAYRHQPVQ